MSGCGSGSVFAADLQLVCTLLAFRVVVLLLTVCCLVIYKVFSVQLMQVQANAPDIYNKCKIEIQTGENAERKDKIKN